MTKLQHLLNEVFDEQPKVDKHEVIEGVKSFGKVGQSLYGGNIMEVAQQLTKIAESAHTHILGEQGDWFDTQAVNKNMGFLKNSVKEFKKTAQESHQLNQRLTGLYEDIGHVLNRYYEIDEHMMTEKMDPVGQEDGDIDNDGDTDSSDEYLQNRRAAIGKAMKGETEEQIDEMPGMIMPIKKGTEWAFNKVKDTLDRRNKHQAAAGAAAGAGYAAGQKIRKQHGGMTPGAKQQAVDKIIMPAVQSGEIDVTDVIKSRNLVKDKLQQIGKVPRVMQTPRVKQTAEGQESRDEKLLRLAGITKEAIEANKPTKRLSDIKDAGIVTPGAVGGLNKKF